MLSAEELLKPRYKVIAGYPGSRFVIGDILYKYEYPTGGSLYCYVMDIITPLNAPTANTEAVETHPHLFEPLPWWKDRKVEELLSIEQSWKDIEGYEGIYQVSNLGLIKSLSREVDRLFKGEKSYKAKRVERLLKFNQRKDKYLTIQLSKGNIATTYYAHVLAADAFIEKVEGKLFINHIDNDRGNPMVSNLERCTQSENLKHAVRTNGYSEKARQRFDRNPNKADVIERIKNAGKHKAQPVKHIGLNGEFLGCYSSIAEAARETGYSSSGIHSQMKNKSISKKYCFYPATTEEYEAYLQTINQLKDGQ